jgi:putative hydrolase of the HAD superfamily
MDVLFDLDGTLVEYERPGQVVLEAAFDRVGVEPFFEVTDFEARYDDFFEQSDSIVELRERIFADIATSRDLDPELGVEVARAYDDERDHTRVRLLPGATDVLDALADRPLAMVTNGDPEMQRPKLEATGLDAYFETVVYAGHDAAPKPDPAPFHLALDAIEGAPDQAVYVGNDPDADVGGAAAAGLDSVWLRNGATTRPRTEPTYTIESLSELFETPILGKSV